MIFILSNICIIEKNDLNLLYNHDKKKDISFSENTFFKSRVNHDNKNYKCILFFNLYTATVINMFGYLIFTSFSFSFKNKITIIVHRTLSVSQLKLLNNISGCKFVFIMTSLLITWHIFKTLLNWNQTSLINVLNKINDICPTNSYVITICKVL